jgi:hypothetical protein
MAAKTPPARCCLARVKVPAVDAAMHNQHLNMAAPLIKVMLQCNMDLPMGLSRPVTCGVG